MAKLFTALFILIASVLVHAQDSTSGDLRSLTLVSGKTPAELAISIGKQFLGKPYIPHTLDQNPTEQLVVNLREFDCTTYLESVLALTLAWQDVASKPNATLSEPAFRQYLTRLRYRNGRIDGYASRLHYFSDWLRDNEQKGLIKDVSSELPGNLTVAKPVSYMTKATYKYPHLSNPDVYKQLALTEASLSQQSFSFIPTKNIRQAESQLREGDIVMLLAARPGLDMKHVGLAIRQPNGRMHLLHASSEQGTVVISPYPISDYLLLHKRLSGIRVARLRPDAINSGLSGAVQGK
ncbi:N-acetylmuramoyl-L-alanine amidase-like domain-containing protein [Spirosoma aerophilum]